MYSNVVLGVEHHNFEEILEVYKGEKGYRQDTDLRPRIGAGSSQLQGSGRAETGNPFPQIRTTSCGAPSARCSVLG